MGLGVPEAMLISGAVGAGSSYLGGKAASQPKQSFSSTQPVLYPGADAGFDLALDQALFNFQNTPDPFADLVFPDIGPSAELQGLLDQLGGLDFTSSGAASLGVKFLDDLLNADIGQNPYVQGLAEDLSRLSVDAFNQTTAPLTSSPFNLAGRTGSGLAFDALENARTEAGLNLDFAVEQLFADAFNANLGAQVQSLGFIPGIEQAHLAPQLAGLQGLIAEADLATQLHQFEVMAQLGEFDLAKEAALFDAGLPTAQLNDLLSTLNSLPHGSTTTGTLPGASIDPLAALLQGAIGGAGTGAGIMNLLGLGGSSAINPAIIPGDSTFFGQPVNIFDQTLGSGSFGLGDPSFGQTGFGLSFEDLFSEDDELSTILDILGG